MKKTSLTVGIPAFNEEANIGCLLKSLVEQDQNRFFINEIIVVSDGSNDKTVSLARSFADKTVKVIAGRKRKGVGCRQNQLLSLADGDVLVLLNADIHINDALFLEKLIKPILDWKADLVTAAIEELSPTAFWERALAAGMRIKKRAFELYRGGHNLYTCFGPARALSRNLYKNLKFKVSIGDDAYCFLYCVTKRFKFVYNRGARVFYQLPATLADHQKQSLRFYSSQKQMAEVFGKEICRHYRLPFRLLARSFLTDFIKSPWWVLVYLWILVVTKIKFLFLKDSADAWPIATSSKTLKIPFKEE